MPHHKSAIKRLRTNAKSNKYNTYYKSTMKTTIKSLLSMNEKEEADKKLNSVYSLLDMQDWCQRVN